MQDLLTTPALRGLGVARAPIDSVTDQASRHLQVLQSDEIHRVKILVSNDETKIFAKLPEHTAKFSAYTVIP